MNDTPPVLTPEPKYSQTKIIFIAKKVIALTLILNALYSLSIAIKDIFNIQGQLEFFNPSATEVLKQKLFKKAIIISSSLFIDTFYGFSLLIKPTHVTKVIHVILGILLLILSKVIFNLTAVDQLLNEVSILFIS